MGSYGDTLNRLVHLDDIVGSCKYISKGLGHSAETVSENYRDISTG